MTMEQLLKCGYIVEADDWMNLVVVWNGSATFNVYCPIDANEYREVDCFTRYNCSNVWNARLIARKWIADRYSEMENYFGQEAA